MVGKPNTSHSALDFDWRHRSFRGLAHSIHKWFGGCTQITENSKIGMSRHLDSSTTTQMAKSWSSMEDPVVPLERNLYGHPLAGLLWERQFEKILLKHGWEKIPNWECLFVHHEKGLF